MGRVTTIYALINPHTSEVRYVGKTLNPNSRLNCHCYPGKKNNTYSACWVKSLRPFKPEMIVLEEVVGEWVESEQFWIAYMKSLGAKLTNLSDGGGGPLRQEISLETRAKMSAAQKGKASPLKGRKQLAEVVAKRAASNTGKTHKKSLKMSTWQIGRELTDAHRAKISESLKVIYNTPEMFEKLSKQRKGRVPWNKGIGECKYEFLKENYIGVFE